MRQRVTFAIAFTTLLGACDRPLSVLPSDSSSAHVASAKAPSVAPPASGAAAAPTALATASASAAPASSSAAPALDPLDVPQLVDADGKPLEQTKDRPSVDSPAFKRRLEVLWSAIVANDAALAERVFFPKVAYEQVKDIKNPAGDWKSRLMKNFARDIARYHEKLGDDARAARFLGLEVDDKRVKWMDPGKEGNKLGYYRVTRSKLRYADAAGTERTLELTSLISWRGEWFVVHLDGFK
jgi:hypothetical protein